MKYLPEIRPVLLALVVAARSLAADVTAFGARGDRATDDTVAVQKAVDAGGGVRFASGTYRLTRTITIELNKTGFVSLTGDSTARVIMAGGGPAFQFIGTHGGSAAPTQFKPDVWARQRSPRVYGLEIVGAHPEADGIAARGTMQFLDCDGVGLQLSNTTLSRVSGFVIRDGRPATNTQPSLVVSGGSRNTICGNTFDRAATISSPGTIVRDNDVLPGN